MAIAALRQTVEVPVGPLTYEDLRELPDESGLRFELLDGVLLMTPSPVRRHQIAALNLATLLKAAAPPNTAVMIAPYDWFVTDGRVFQPDVFVVPDSGRDETRYEGVPLLAVEVLSPSTRARDLGIKRLAYAEAGLAYYWVVDPDTPSLTAFHLVNGRLTEYARSAGDERFETVAPFRAVVVPTELIAP